MSDAEKRISLLVFLEGQQPRSWHRVAALISFTQKKKKGKKILI